MTRQRGVTVYPMPEEVAGPPAISGPYALLIRDRSTPSMDETERWDYVECMMVHREGVSYRVSHGKPWRWTDYSKTAKWWSMWELIELVTINNIEGVDLADWVRTFGSRLESNFQQVHYWATSTSS